MAATCDADGSVCAAVAERIETAFRALGACGAFLAALDDDASIDAEDVRRSLVAVGQMLLALTQRDDVCRSLAEVTRWDDRGDDALVLALRGPDSSR